MPRIARVAVPEVPYHITQRGNGCRIVFYNDADRLTYLRLLARAAEEHRMNIQAYCLMSNHIHLIAVPHRPDSLARALGCAHAGFARYRNLSDDSCGHVWQARYFSCPLDRAHLWRAIAYVERNPVRAGMVETAEEYRWSSAQAHLGRDHMDAFLDLGEWQGRAGPRRWREVLRGGFEEAAFQQRLRDASIQGRALGSLEFVEQLERQAGRRLRPKPPGRPRKKEAPLIDTVEQMLLEIGI
jgi:putative transposase